MEAASAASALPLCASSKVCCTLSPYTMRSETCAQTPALISASLVILRFHWSCGYKSTRISAMLICFGSVPSSGRPAFDYFVTVAARGQARPDPQAAMGVARAPEDEHEVRRLVERVLRRAGL